MAMPTYEYECMECKNRFDVFQSMNDIPIERCVKCNGKVRKLFSSTGIIFKGSGFYVNDYKNNETGKKKSETDVKKDGAPASAVSGPVKPDSGTSES